MSKLLELQKKLRDTTATIIDTTQAMTNNPDSPSLRAIASSLLRRQKRLEEEIASEFQPGCGGSDWYEEYIEPGIRSVVRLLRDNGVNTTCSCDHEMYVQCEITNDGFIKHVDNLLFNNGYRDYTIVLRIERISGHAYSFLEITFQKGAEDGTRI